MNPAACVGLALAALALSTPAWPGTAAVTAPRPELVAPGIWLFLGVLLDRQPDGNTVNLPRRTG